MPNTPATPAPRFFAARTVDGRWTGFVTHPGAAEATRLTMPGECPSEAEALQVARARTAPLGSRAQLLLVNPKFPHNVGSALRAASCFGAERVAWTGDRVSLEVGLGERLPREERMKAYQDVDLHHIDGHRPLDVLAGTPVAVELLPGTEPLHLFDHPDDAVYVFGPEDGTLPKGIRTACHRFVTIPSFHCLNLAAATYLVLYDRAVKRWQQYGEPVPELSESRGVWHTSVLEER